MMILAAQETPDSVRRHDPAVLLDKFYPLLKSP